MRLTTNLAVCVTIVLLTTTGCIRRSLKKQDLLLATVGEKKIRESDFRAQLERLDPTLRGKYRRNRAALLDKMIEEELLYQHALDRNLAGTPEAKKRLSRLEEEIAIQRLMQLEVLSKVTVSKEEIEKRYLQEVNRREGSSIVKSILYISNLEENNVREQVNVIERELREGLSFPEVAKRNSLGYQMLELDSADFNDLPQEVRKIAVMLNNRSGGPINLGPNPFYFFKDTEPLSSCFRRIRRAIRDEKGERALRKWLSSRRAASTIRLHEEALDDMNRTAAAAAEVNGVSLTVGDVAILLEGLSVQQRRQKVADKKALLDEAVDREILRQEALKRRLHEAKFVKERLAKERRRILVELVIEQDVAGITPAAREESLAGLLAELKKAAGVKIVAENLKKMYIPSSKDIQDIFGGEPI
ncbi:hypothetical protein HQ563_00335 [bacterium]|nr:hypothetical protein [bacterium]